MEMSKFCQSDKRGNFLFVQSYVMRRKDSRNGGCSNFSGNIFLRHDASLKR